MKFKLLLERTQYLWALLITIIIVIFCFLPWIGREPTLGFIKDGAFSYFTYKLIYTDLVTSKTFPLWNFAAWYGQSMQPLYIAVGPSKFITMAVGVLFGVTNVYLLFIVSIFIDLSILIIGMMLLARHLQIHPMAAMIAATSLALITKWQSLYYFRHHVFIPLPLIFYYAIRFAKSIDFRFLALSGVLTCLFFFDGTPYLPVLFFYQTLLFIILAVAVMRPRLVAPSPNCLTHPKTIFLFILCVVLAGLFLYSFHELFSGKLIAYRGGRQPDLSLSLSQFQEQIKVPSSVFYKYRRFLYGLGTLPLVFFLSSIYHSRKASLLEKKYLLTFALFMLISGLVVFDSTGVVARLYYFLPGMKFYRFGDGFLTYAIAAFMIMAMLGMSYYFKNQKLGKYSSAEIIFALVLLGVGLFLLPPRTDSIPFLQSRNFNLVNVYSLATHAPQIQLLGFGIAALILAIFRFIRPTGNRVVYGTAVLFLAVEIITSNAFWINGNIKNAGEENLVPSATIKQTLSLPVMIPPYVRDDNIYHRVDFTHYPLPTALKQGHPARNHRNGSISYSNTSYNFIFLSAERLFVCTPLMLNDYIARNTENFFRLYGGFDDRRISGLVMGGISDKPYDALRWIEDTSEAKRFLGCNSPIIRLAQNVAYANEDHEATAILQRRKLTDVIQIPNKQQTELAISNLYRVSNTQADSVTMKKYWGNEIGFEVQNKSDKNRWAIIADTFDENWHAWVNGHPQPVQRANIAFKAIEVPPGESKVILKYQDFGSFLSIGCIVLTTVSLLVWFFLVWFKELGGWKP